LWAKNLQVVTGANTVQYNTLHTDKIDGSNKPDIALDVGNLGGMYANKILLMGTEDGVGVNSKGVIAANSGDIIVTNAGKVVLGGSTTASGNIQIQAKGFSNQGTLYAGGNTNVVTQGELANSGVLAAGQQTMLTAGTVNSTGTLGAGVKSDGSLGT
ncbi:hypothetical protein Ga0466249_005408, partial [Sporomusaceae bacterium BoRhaA]|uniref:hypothetical protein n=1 Tax=Pelorhabdus rhamnosifermentans TaxID=2772457 RepID=UPI001C062B40